LKTIQKALTVLNQFSETRPVLGITDLSKATGINKSIVHKILQSLMEGDLIARDTETRRYRLGSGILKLAGRHLANLRPLDIARPHLLQLWEETSETIHFVVQDNLSTMITQVYESPRSLRVSSHLGEIGSLHGSAAGKVFMAFGTESLLDRFLETELEALTSHTITQPEKLKIELAKVKKKGFGISQEEQETDFCAIAAPIIDTTGRISGVVAIAIPPSRFKGKRITELSKNLLKMTNSIMKEFGTPSNLRP
jgi:DNA-binding IclR family transcriptional regulator